VALSRPLVFHEVGQRLLDACSVALASPTATGVASAPDRAVLTSGDLADDCDCGLLAVSVLRSYRSSAPPAETGGFTAGSSGAASPCVPPYVVAELAVRIVRCVPGPDERGRPPSPAAMLAAARQVESDAYEVECASLTALEALDGDLDGWTVTNQPRTGPSGQCAGSELRAVVWVSR
jgi:hypothetical protein